MPETSVIIPFHDRVEWLEQAIASVLQQTYQDFEIIVVDDGSEQEYRACIENLDQRIRYIRQEQRGSAAARNAGVKMAVGEFIAFLDSDDLFLPEKLAIQTGILRDHPDLVLVHSSFFRMDISGNEIDMRPYGSFTGFVYPRIYFQCRILTSTVVVRKKLFEKLEFEERARYGQDAILFGKIAKLGEIWGVERPLAKYRMHGNNVAKNPDKQIEAWKNVLQFGIHADPDVKFILRQQIESSYYLKFAFQYVQKKDYVPAFLCVMKSFLKWPFQKDLCMRLARFILPQWIKGKWENS
jgi:glycosyltransferase involved in cell wall biosynthesis